jgi:hypothetical protein
MKIKDNVDMFKSHDKLAIHIAQFSLDQDNLKSDTTIAQLLTVQR